MKLRKLVLLVLLSFLPGITGFAFSQIDTLPPQIINPDTLPILYCSDSVLVAPAITIKNVTIDESNEGMKISIANYRAGEDFLVWEKVHDFSYNWRASNGTLEIKGVGSSQQYQDAVRKIYYKNNSETPTLNTRSFSVSLLDADYFPNTQHFYRYVSKLDITWKEAKATADTMAYYGLQGYMATITSSSENDFIWTKIDGVGWIGASDEQEEGKWIWATGPEEGLHFWQGSVNGSPVSGRYSKWASGEPNNLNNEDYAHINQNPGKVQKSWNDLRNEGDGPGSQYYRAQGFVVEFGGTEGDPEVSLSATAKIQINKIAFSNQREFTICAGETQELNLSADKVYSYTWTPDYHISSTIVSNPLVYPGYTSTYKAVGVLDQCIDSAYFTVNVEQLPLSELETDTIICEGNSVVLDAGIHTAYKWSTGETTRTIQVKNEGWYFVELKNVLDCSTSDSIEVKWSVRPELDYGEMETLVCGSFKQKLKIAFVNGTASSNLIPLQPDKARVENPTTLTPTIIVNEYGIYQFQMEIEDAWSCSFLDTLEIAFHNQPEAEFVMDDQKCKGYSLDLEFDGITFEEAIFSWYSNDTVYQSEEDLKEITIPLGYGQINRTVGLKVNEKGCMDSSFVGVTVVPIMDFWVEENARGCTPLQTLFSNTDIEDIDSYFWDFGDGNSSTTEKPSHNYENTDTSILSYDVSLSVVSSEGCKNTGILKDTVTVYPIPTVDFSFEDEDCNPETMEIWYTGSGNDNDTYYWDLTAFQTGEIIQNPEQSRGPLEFERYSEPTVLIGIQVVSEFGCKSDTLTKLWKRKPVFSIEVDKTEDCPPLQTGIKATVLDDVDRLDFTYNLGDGTSGKGDSVLHIFTQQNTKNEVVFTGYSNITNCTDTVVYSEKVFVYPVPDADFIPNPNVVLIDNPTIQFENTSTGANSYEWDFGDESLVSEEKNPAHQFLDMGFYTTLLAVFNDYGCMDSISKQVVVAFDKLFPPTAFSPNAILDEDREFRIYAEGVTNDGYQLQIFNRWGEMFFESLSQDSGWNGKMKSGNFAPAGVYTWVIQYRDFRGEKHKQQGTVTLLF